MAEKFSPKEISKMEQKAEKMMTKREMNLSEVRKKSFFEGFANDHGVFWLGDRSGTVRGVTDEQMRNDPTLYSIDSI